MIYFVMFPAGLKLAFLRRGKGLTQAELSKRSGIPQANISHIEQGRQDPTVSTLIRICSSLGVPPALLFQEKAPPGHFVWTRHALERVAEAVVGPPGRIRAREKEIVELLRDVVPGLRRRLSSKRVYQSWYELRQQLSAVEIRTLVERVRDVRQRLHEKNAPSQIF